ncbi:Arl5family small GTPase [Pelomyxa schiedti]|nr:Arl5family small GTPase [Pelomyxa schiedti]
MGSVFAKLWARMFSVPEFKVVVVGLASAGKTTIVYKLLLNEVVATSPTVGSNVEELVYKNVRMIIWDLSGGDMMRDAWCTYYMNSSAVVLVVDSSDRSRMPTVKMELAKLLSHEASLPFF